MKPFSSLRPLAIGAVASLIVGIVLALTVGGPVSWLLAFVGPLMVVITLVDRITDARTEAKRRLAELTAAQAHRLEPNRWLSAGSNLRTWWQIGVSAPTPRLTRIGVQRMSARHFVPGAGHRRTEVVLAVDLSGGLSIEACSSIDSLDEILDGVHRAMRCSRAREYSPHEEAPSVTVVDACTDRGVFATSSAIQARWNLVVDENGYGVLRDRQALEEVRENILVDMVPPAREQQVCELEQSSQQLAVSDLDLVAQGPHALISGSTGSGKTQFVIAWLTSMARRVSASEIAIAIIDFKGGGSFTGLSQLPHVRHVTSDLDPKGVRAALDGLRAQMRLRERAMAEHGVSDVGDIPSQSRPPRLILVVDELRALAEGYVDSVPLLADIGARGRSLGMHLILATQHFRALRSNDLLANIHMRILLRPQDRDEAQLLFSQPVVWSAPAVGKALVSGVRSQLAELSFVPVSAMSPIRPADGGSDIVHPTRLWLEPLRQPPELLPLELLSPELMSSLHRQIQLCLRDDHELLERIPVLWSAQRDGVLIVTESSGARRREIGALVCAQTLAPLWLGPGGNEGGSPAAAWDALAQIRRNAGHSPAPSVTALVVPELDALVSLMPASWREEFIELVFETAHEFTQTGRPVYLGFASEAALSLRFAQLHSWNGDLRASDELFAATSEPVRMPGRTALRTFDQIAITEQQSSRELIIVSPRPDVWWRLSKSRPELTYRVFAPEKFFSHLLATPETGGSPKTCGVVLDGCTQAEVRSFRIIFDRLPPPALNTAFFVHGEGHCERIDITALFSEGAREVSLTERGANVSDSTASAKNIEV